jgi:trk system potassium uptake protein TrkA
MYVIIAGCGRIGAMLVNRLAESGHNVVVVDRDRSSFSFLGNGCNCLTITGMPIDEDVLKEAGIERADALLAVTEDDNINIMVSQIAKQLFNVPLVIMQTNNPERQQVLISLGFDVICPTTLTVDSLIGSLSKGVPAK